MSEKILISLLFLVSLTGCNRTMVAMDSTPTDARVVINQRGSGSNVLFPV
jgi:hypothetical protein